MESLSKVENFLEDVSDVGAPSQLALRRCISEQWFSDTLAWLLDPKGSHGAGVRFLQEFVKRVGKRRCEGGYARRESHLKFGKGGRGRGSTSFNFGNAAVLREFFLARGVGRDGLSGSRYCDLVVMDLDSRDGFFLVIENKLFTANRPGQLREYLEVVEDRYRRAEVREYVYLTLNGHKPIRYRDSDKRVLRRWVPISWAGDILEILESLEGMLSVQALRVRNLLRWLRQLIQLDKVAELSSNDVDTFRGLLLKAAAECLFEELQRLGEGKQGTWRIKTRTDQTVRLVHSSLPKQWLYVEMLPTFSITMQTRYNQRAQFEKILVPYGAVPDQVFNLLDLSARELYHRHFRRTKNYLGNRRRLRARLTPMKKKYSGVFEFLHRRKFQVQILLTAADKVWEAVGRDYIATVQAGVAAQADSPATEQPL